MVESWPYMVVVLALIRDTYRSGKLYMITCVHKTTTTVTNNFVTLSEISINDNQLDTMQGGDNT